MIGALSLDWDLEAEQAQLNEEGNKGWELVCSIIRDTDNGQRVVHYFKREIPPFDTNVDRKTSSLINSTT